jgi:predicted nuclease of predicted toxin-antitoxin system
MRCLIDQDVYHFTIVWLREEGHDIITAKELGMSRADDEVLLRKAGEIDRLFLTRDKDFGTLVFLKAALSNGVIFLRMAPANFEEVHQQLRRLLREHTQEELMQRYCVVEPHRYRIRRLPQS